MNMYDFSQLVVQTITIAKKKSLNKTFFLTPDTMQKTKNISDVISTITINAEKFINFDTAFNTLELTVKCYVFEIANPLLQILAENTDLICIDAEDDGKLCIQMKICNAATII